MLPAFPPRAEAPTVRLALISTPGSGESWLRRLLANAYQLDEIVAETVHDVPWDTLPDRAVVQICWPCQPSVEQMLAEAGLRPVVLVRHPFDVLVSALADAAAQPRTFRWADDPDDTEASIARLSPASEAFLRYAQSSRVADQLAVGQQWWNRSTAQRLRYEDLAADPAGALARIGRILGHPLADPVWHEVVDVEADAARPGRAADRHRARAGWLGLWRHVIPTEALTELYCRHLPLLYRLGYPIDMPPLVTVDQAEMAWHRLTHIEVGSPFMLTQHEWAM